jgi:hypothetical protein
MSDTISPNGHDQSQRAEGAFPSPQSPSPSPAPKAHRPALNAHRATGPRTPEGKKRSSLNALRHGLTGHTIVLPSEDLAAYERHVQSYVDEYKPKGATEQQLVQDLADTAWRINRIPALENNLLSLAVAEYACGAGPLACENSGFKVSHPEAQAALAMTKAVLEQHKALASLSMHGQRLSRQFHKTREMLIEILEKRKKQERNELERAADLVEMHAAEEEAYEPAEDRFVFSNDEIEDFIQQRDRNHRARKAGIYNYQAVTA